MSESLTARTAEQRALDLQRAGGVPLPEGEGERIAYELIAAAEEAGKSVDEYVVEYARGLDVKAPAPGMKSAFWSHGVPHPELPPGVLLSNQFVAGVWTEDENTLNPGTARYLEGTPGGDVLGQLHLWNSDVYKTLGLNKEQGEALARNAWAALSEEYAKATDGEAVAFVQTLAPWTVAYETEMPQLRQGTGPENIHFMYDLPEDVLKGLPPESQALLSEGRVRSHLHFIAPDENAPPTQKYWAAGYLDLDHLKSLPTPEAQRAAVLEVCAKVAHLDGREADVEKLTEELLSLRAEQETAAPGVEEQQPASLSAQTPQTQQTAETQQAAETAETQQQTQEAPEPQEAAQSGHAPVVPVAPVPAPVPAAVGAHGFNYMVGFTPEPAKVIPGAHGGPRPAEPTQAPPAPAKAHGTDMGM
ncbi:hypothetical protein [Streptomyces avermitilis]|uniref:hypothetical protein n=1 Tax=Streptomyces avermitilis TaxID=33903 RepID=UPI003830F9EB